VSDKETVKILMIEDNELHRQMYGMQFRQAGYVNFTAVSTGGEGLRIMTKEKPDLLLLDIALDNMDGVEVLKRVRDNEGLADLPVIVLSNMREEDKGSEVRKLGIKDYILKAELLPREIVERVERNL